MDQHLEHLRLLSIFHFVLATVTALFAWLPTFHLLVGLSTLTGNLFPADISHGLTPPFLAGWAMILFAALLTGFGWLYAVALVVAGYCLSRRKAYLFCLVTAGISCTVAPAGTVLGVFTIIVLTRPSVKTLFQE